VLLYYMCIHTFQVFNANPIKFLCVLKLCTLNKMCLCNSLNSLKFLHCSPKQSAERSCSRAFCGRLTFAAPNNKTHTSTQSLQNHLVSLSWDTWLHTFRVAMANTINSFSLVNQMTFPVDAATDGIGWYDHASCQNTFHDITAASQLARNI